MKKIILVIIACIPILCWAQDDGNKWTIKTGISTNILRNNNAGLLSELRVGRYLVDNENFRASVDLSGAYSFSEDDNDYQFITAMIALENKNNTIKGLYTGVSFGFGLLTNSIHFRQQAGGIDTFYDFVFPMTELTIGYDITKNISTGGKYSIYTSFANMKEHTGIGIGWFLNFRF